MPAPPRTPVRPLLVRLGAVGDMINATALAAGLAEAWGAPCDVVTLPGSPARVLEGLPFVGEVMTLSSRRTPYPLSPNQWRLVAWLRRRGPGPAWVAEERDHSGKLDWLLDRGGLGRTRRATMREVPRLHLEHAVDYLVRLGRQVPEEFAAAGPGRPFPDPPPAPRLAISGAELDDARRWLAGRGWEGGPLVVVQAQARRMNRGRWPVAAWREAIASVLADLPDATVLLAGAAHERRETAELAAACADPRVADAAGELPLRRLFAVLALAHSAISLDTGPAHAAAAAGCPVVVLPGRADPRRNRPFGPPERVAVVAAWPPAAWPDDATVWWNTHDMGAIPVAGVVAAWRRLARRAAPVVRDSAR